MLGGGRGRETIGAGGARALHGGRERCQRPVRPSTSKRGHASQPGLALVPLRTWSSWLLARVLVASYYILVILLCTQLYITRFVLQQSMVDTGISPLN
eukprot:SAG31_NODE_7043_length_1806_cov_5.626247_1_plen_98_part_00